MKITNINDLINIIYLEYKIHKNKWLQSRKGSNHEIMQWAITNYLARLLDDIYDIETYEIEWRKTYING